MTHSFLHTRRQPNASQATALLPLMKQWHLQNTRRHRHIQLRKCNCLHRFKTSVDRRSVTTWMSAPHAGIMQVILGQMLLSRAHVTMLICRASNFVPHFPLVEFPVAPRIFILSRRRSLTIIFNRLLATAPILTIKRRPALQQPTLPTLLLLIPEVAFIRCLLKILNQRHYDLLLHLQDLRPKFCCITSTTDVRCKLTSKGAPALLPPPRPRQTALLFRRIVSDSLPELMCGQEAR